jgi:hypothetical protein
MKDKSLVEYGDGDHETVESLPQNGVSVTGEEPVKSSKNAPA